MQFGVRENSGRYDNFDYDNDNDNESDNGSRFGRGECPARHKVDGANARPG